MTEPGELVKLAEYVERRPDIARDVFASVEGGANLVLPGSDTHERYAGIEEVGLAAVIGEDVEGRNYSPFDPGTLARLAFNADNRSAHPGAWTPKDADAEMLGGPVPEWLGRFTAYALAKINFMAASTDVRSYDRLAAAIEPGKVGIAGGQWRLGSLVGVSGLWEVHDDLMGSVLAHEMVRAAEAAQAGSALRTADDVAADLEPILAEVKSIHEGAPAAELSRDQVARLLVAMDEVTSERLPGSSEANLPLAA